MIFCDKKFHISKFFIRAVPHNVDELVEDDFILTDAPDHIELEHVYRSTQCKGWTFRRRMGVYVGLTPREVWHREVPRIAMTTTVIEFRVSVSQIRMNCVCYVPLQTLRVQNTSEASPYILERLLPP